MRWSPRRANGWCKRARPALAYHGQARPALAEVEAANRALFLASRAGEQGGWDGRKCTSCIAPLRARWTQVAQAAADGQTAIAETTVQYLTLDETVYTGQHPEMGHHAAAATRRERKNTAMETDR